MPATHLRDAGGAAGGSDLPGQRADLPGLGELNFLAVIPWPDAIDDQEITDLTEGHQGMVPTAATVVHTLTTVGQKSTRRIGKATRHHDQKVGASQGNEGLATEWMALKHAHRKRQADRLSLRQTDRGLSVHTFNRCQRVEALRGPMIDREHLARSSGVDNVAEFDECCGCQRFDQ